MRQGFKLRLLQGHFVPRYINPRREAFASSNVIEMSWGQDLAQSKDLTRESVFKRLHLARAQSSSKDLSYAARAPSHTCQTSILLFKAHRAAPEALNAPRPPFECQGF